MSAAALEPQAPNQLRLDSAQGRWTLLATVLGSAMVIVDGTVVNIALPWIGRDLGAGMDGLQWTVSGYLLTLASLILIGGSLGDRFGRQRVFTIGVLWFAAASLFCGVSPNLAALIAARVVQGIGGALLTPGSLAIIEASFASEDRGKAIGAWSGLGGIATAIGPFLGGYLTEAVSWRWIFLINLPFAVAVAWIALRHVPESSDPDAPAQLDLTGAALAVLGLGITTFALIEAPTFGPRSPLILGAGTLGVVGLIAFGLVEARTQHPMLPLRLFRSRAFTGTNLVTLAMYGALSALSFLLTLQLQQVVGYSAVAAGASALPITVLLLVISPFSGQLAQRIGPRVPLTVGPLVTAVGIALLARVDRGSVYLVDILPALLVSGLGLALTVAPLTATVMGAVEESHAGIASAVNNAVARAAGLVAVAVLPVLAGLTGNAYLDPQAFAAGYRSAMLLASGLAAAAGLIGWLTLREARIGGYASG
jgi:EmrB/QacA subfamily drug resistance transporter